MTNITDPQDVLQDVLITKSGKPKVQPWRHKKTKTMYLAQSLHRIADSADTYKEFQKTHKKANRIWHCGSRLEFTVENGVKRLKTASFCRGRMCAMCDWRRSMKTFWEVSKVMDEVQKQHPNLKPIFLTMTVKNCTGEELSATLDEMFGGFHTFTTHRKSKRLIQGWFRALEVTCNPDEYVTEKGYKKRKKFYDRNGIGVGDPNPVYETYHPHMHLVILVDKSYFSKGNKDYMTAEDWSRLWKISLKLDYDPVCDIRKTQKTGEGKVKVAEVAKYTLKDTEFIVKGEPDKTDKMVKDLSVALKGRRLTAYGGIMKKIHKELNLADNDENLVNITDEITVRDDLSSMVEIYDWSFGMLDYFRRADM